MTGVATQATVGADSFVGLWPQSVLDALPDIVFVKDCCGVYRQINEAGIAFLGRPRAEIIGAKEQDLFPLELALLAEEVDRMVIEQGRSSVRISRWCRADGQERSLEVTKRPLKDDSGAIIGLAGIAHDVTAAEVAERDRQRATEELAGARIALARASETLAEKRSEQILAALGEAVIGVDTQGVISFFNPSAERMLGYAAATVLGGSVLNVLRRIDSGTANREKSQTGRSRSDTPGEEHRGGQSLSDGEWLRELLGQTDIRTGGTATFRRHDGKSFIGEYAFLSLQHERTTTGSVIVVRDVTAREDAAQRLRTLSRAVEESPAAVSLTDARGVIHYINRRFTEITGYTEADALGMTHKLIASGRTPPAVYEDLWATIRAGQEWSGDLLNRRRSGRTYLCATRITPLLDSHGVLTHFLTISEDVTAQRELATKEQAAREAAERALRDVAEQERRLRLLTDSLPALVNYFSIEDRVIYCNQPYAELFGFERDEAVGRFLPELIGEATYAVLKTELDSVKSGQELCYEREIQGRLFQVTMRPARNDLGDVRGVYALLLDVTQQKQIAGELSMALSRAEAASEAKDQFLANISHEIRTPMNAIIGLSELLLRTRLDDRQRDYLEKSHRSAMLLLGLLNDVLDFSKIQAGHLKLDVHRFRVPDLLTQISDLYRDAAMEQGLEFVIAPGADLPVEVMGDSLRLTQVISNLCSNAIKFTPQGSVTVRIACQSASEASVVLEFSVSDTGIGMTPEQTDRIFDPFSQADGSTTRRFGGTGLGLSICRDLLGLMGSRLELETQPGHGSRFQFTVTLDLPEPGQMALPTDEAASIAATERRAELAGRRILVVDDYVLNLEIVTAFLTDAKCQVRVAHHGREALEWLKYETFDAVLMDVQMPVMDGYETTRVIRQNPEWRDLPVIAMTANVLESDREKCAAVGMNDFIPKPVMVESLLATLANHLRHLPLAEVAPSAHSEPVISPPRVPSGEHNVELMVDQLVGIDMDVALQSTMGQMSFLIRVLHIFVDTQSDFEARFLAAREPDGGDGANSDPAAPGRIAHTLKGAAASIGAESLRVAALALEQSCKQGAEDSVVNDALARVVAELTPVLTGIARALPQQPGAANG